MRLFVYKEIKMKRGYARVSLVEQSLDRQIEALTSAGCQEIYCDKISGAKASRPELDRLFIEAQPGDCIVVQKLDRLGRSILDLLTKVELMRSRQIDFKSINDSFDTSTSNGRLMLNLLCSFAEYERELIRERTKDAISSARKRGVKMGRPVQDNTGRVQSIKMMQQEGKSQEQILTELGIRKSRYYELLGEMITAN